MIERLKNFVKENKGLTILAALSVTIPSSIAAIHEAAKEDDKTFKKFLCGIAAIVGTFSSAMGIANFLKTTFSIKEKKEDENARMIEAMAEERIIKAKAAAGVYRRPKEDQDPDPDPDKDNDNEGETWIEAFKERFTMPALPPFIARIMEGVPTGYEEAMLLHLCSMLGAMCFSKVRALYSDGIIHAANLQVVVEGNWGTGKAKFEQLFKELFSRIIDRCKEKIDIMSERFYEGHYIVQTTGIGTSMTKYVDILAENQNCHMYIFNSEIRALFYDLKKGNGLNFDFLRKAFENGDVCRNNKAKESKNGLFSIFLNYTFTGTPKDINTSFRKELEGGTLSRIAWTCIPEQGRETSKLQLPKGDEMEALKDQIDEWAKTYCFYNLSKNEEIAVDDINIDLRYVCEELDEWNKSQYDLSVEENNPARKDVRLRMAAIAFHCAIVLHMLYDNPAPSNWQKRKQVADLTIFIANYCIERFLHKFGKEQNEQRKENQKAEMIDKESRSSNTSNSSGPKQAKITDIAELKRLHDMLDDKKEHRFGWDTLAKLSGMKPSTVRKKIRDYEDKLKNQIYEVQ